MSTSRHHESRPVIGFIGLGDQGAPIAQAISAAGFPLLVWARRPESLGALDGYASTAVSSVAELAARSDVVALCLRDDADNIEIATTGGLLEHMRQGSILVNHGTGLPAEARRLSELARPYGIDVLDAPVSGGHAVALARELTTIVGGPPEALARVRSVLESFSKLVIHVGDAGAGQLGKLFNNALMMMNQQSIAQTLAAADSLDLPLKSLLDVLRAGSARSFALEAFGPSITTANAEHLQQLELIDMDLFKQAAGRSEAARTMADRAVAGASQLTETTSVIETALHAPGTNTNELL
jgi:3-hydroxyisobutyrate dehydrogenase-like beta-hydroxyacid dehydrogenase